MSKKWLWIVLGLVGFFAVGGVSLLAFLSYKIRDIKEPLIATLKSYVDGELKIGDAQVRMFPTGIDLTDVVLLAPGETEPSATVKRAEIRFNLLPLLQKKIQTRLIVVEPNIRLHRDAKGVSNMERIFRPLIQGENKGQVSAIDKLWWRRLAVDKLVIKDAQFVSTAQKSPAKTELKNLQVEANHIRFERADEPASIKIQFELPSVSAEPMRLATEMSFDEAKQKMLLKDGSFSWAKAVLAFEGEAGLPGEIEKEVMLALALKTKDPIDLKELGKALKNPIPASGKISASGTVNGTPFEPTLQLQLNSPNLQAGGKSLSNFQANLRKQGEPLEIQSATFGLYGGSVSAKGKLNPLSPPGGDLQISLRSLSLAAASGSKNSARLSGNVHITSSNLAKLNSWAGGGDVSVGPIALPVMNFKEKIKIAEVLSAGTQVGSMVNVGMLSSSSNVIGSQIPSINAKIKLSGGNIALVPFSMGNGHFNASGSGNIYQQKSIQASGTFTLNQKVTAQLFPDANFRSFVTGKRGVVSFPFTASGPLDNPNISIDSSNLRGMIAKATAMGLANLLAGGIKPDQMLNQALKNTPLGDPKNPLSQILGTSTSNQPTTTGTSSRTSSKTATSTNTSSRKSNTRTTRSTSGNRVVDQFLFGR